MADEARVKVPIRADGLQLADHRRFQRGFWLAERIGWAGFGLVIALALAGLTGRGGWMSVQEAQVGTARVEWPRVARRGETVAVVLSFADGARHEVELGKDLLDHYDLAGTVPDPVRSVATPDGIAMLVDTEGRAPQTVRVALRARRVGAVDMRIVADGVVASGRGLVLP